MDHAFYVRGRKVSLRLSKWTTTTQKRAGVRCGVCFVGVAITDLAGTRRAKTLSWSTSLVLPQGESFDEEH